MGSLFHPFASNTSILAGIGYSIFGMAVVFLMLWVLMLVIGVMARIARRNQEKEAAPEAPDRFSSTMCRMRRRPCSWPLWQMSWESRSMKFGLCRFGRWRSEIPCDTQWKDL